MKNKNNTSSLKNGKTAMKNKMIILLLLTVLFSLFICSCGKDEISDPVTPNNSGDTQNEDPQKDPQNEDPQNGEQQKDPQNEEQQKDAVDPYEMFKHVYYIRHPNGIEVYNPYKENPCATEMDFAKDGEYLEYENEIEFFKVSFNDGFEASIKVFASERNGKKLYLYTRESNGGLINYLTETYGIGMSIFVFNSDDELFIRYTVDDLGGGVYLYTLNRWATKDYSYESGKSLINDALGDNVKEGQGYICAYLSPGHNFYDMHTENERSSQEEIFESWGEEISQKWFNKEKI